jgi:hypothetical protein
MLFGIASLKLSTHLASECEEDGGTMLLEKRYWDLKKICPSAIYQ